MLQYIQQNADKMHMYVTWTCKTFRINNSVNIHLKSEVNSSALMLFNNVKPIA